MPGFSSSHSRFTRLRIGGRLIAGFAVVCAVLALSGGVTLWQMATVSQSTSLMVDVRSPAIAAAASSPTSTLLAALRGYVLTGAEAQKQQRAATWRDINAAVQRMDEIAAHFTNQDNVRRWREEARGTASSSAPRPASRPSSAGRRRSRRPRR